MFPSFPYRVATAHALSVIRAKLRSFLPSAGPEDGRNLEDHLLDKACDTMLASLTPMLAGFTDGALERAFVSSFLSFFLVPWEGRDVLKALIRWFSRTRGMRFVAIAM